MDDFWVCVKMVRGQFPAIIQVEIIITHVEHDVWKAGHCLRPLPTLSEATKKLIGVVASCVKFCAVRWRHAEKMDLLCMVHC